MEYLKEIEYTHANFGELYDELPLWSAPFGLLLLKHVPLKRGMKILDLGAGTGFLTIELAQRCGSDAEIIAVDPWQAAMSRLRHKLDFLGISNVRLILQDAETVELGAQSIDLIVSNLGINNFEHPEKVLANCFRVLRDNGRLLFTTNLVGHMQEFYDQFQATLLDHGLKDQIPVLEEHINHRGTIQSVSQLVTQADFNLINVHSEQFKMRFADGSALLRHYFIRLGFLPGWKSIVPPQIIEEVFTSLEQRLNSLSAKQGELSLTIPMACFEARK